MLSSFRLVMTWLHTWFGLILGFVLMVVFFFGSLSVFASEIDRWAIPETRLESQAMPSFDSVIRPVLEGLLPEPDELEAARQRAGGSQAPLTPLYWSVWQDRRNPELGFYAEFALDPKQPSDFLHAHAAIDPASGKRLHQKQLAIGSDLFFPLHFTLTLHWQNLGIWIVGLSSLIMLVALISGVVIHKKIFREFFTFRPSKKGQRRVLDFHNLTGVLALPFHLIFAFTGLVIFAGIYLPLEETVLQGVHEYDESRRKGTSELPDERANIPAPLGSVDAMIAEAKRRWTARGMSAEVSSIEVHRPLDANGYIVLFPPAGPRLATSDTGITFEATSGRVLRDAPPSSVIERVNRFVTGIHLMPFEHWLLRWLFFVGGLISCACIATGFIFFVGKRKHKHAAQSTSGARWVDALAVTAMTGMLIATFSIMVVNRLLPLDLTDRPVWEVRAFWGAWCLSFLHAAVRTAPVQAARFAPAWREQCYAAALLALVAVLLNWITTGDHLAKTVRAGYWPVAGVDLTLIITAATAAFAGARLRRKEDDERAVERSPETRTTPIEVAHG